MTLDEKKDYLRRIFNLATLKGLCRTQKDFAALLEIDPTGLSSAMNGSPRALTDSLVAKVKKLSRRFQLDGEAPSPEFPPQQGGVWIPAETAQLYNNMSETIRIQAEIIARFQAMPGAAASAASPLYRDRK